MEDRFVSGLLGLSFFKWWFLLIPKVGMTLFVVYVCCMGWMKLGPRKPMPDTARMKAADRAVERIVDNIRQNRGDVRSVALCHFANDASDYFSHRLRERIEKSNVLDLTDFDFAEKLRTLLNVRNRGVANATDALSSIQGEEVDGVLWGSIERFESAKGGGGATLTGEWQLVDKGGAVVCGGAIQREDGESGIVETFTNAIDDLGKSTDGVEIVASTIPWYMRLLGFVLLVLLLPVVTISFVRTMVAKRSNKVNVFVLGVYTAIDVILAFFMVGGTIGSFAAVVVFLAASLSALLYNMSLMSFALRLESE